MPTTSENTINAMFVHAEFSEPAKQRKTMPDLTLKAGSENTVSPNYLH